METSDYEPKRRVEIDIDDVLAAMRAQTWRNLSIYRTGQGLAEVDERLRFWSGYVLKELFAGPRGWDRSLPSPRCTVGRTWPSKKINPISSP